MNLNESLLLSLLNVSFICCLGNLYIFVMSICTCRQMSVRVCILLSSRGEEGLDGLNEEFTCKLWGEKKKLFQIICSFLLLFSWASVTRLFTTIYVVCVCMGTFIYYAFTYPFMSDVYCSYITVVFILRIMDI